MATYKIIEPIGPDCDLTYTLTQAMWIISARDYIDLRIIHKTPAAYIVAWVTPDESLLPPHLAAVPADVDLKNIQPVRGFNHTGGIRVTPVDGVEGRCKVEYVVHSEIKGQMPVWIVNKGTGGAIDGIFANLRKAIHTL
ncbi:hypothetical protein HDU67_009753 [Dinochytrium kinnereticum]|nr:hypothetical protein HDU67_009753 [Dinochytrium kinnereticum]